jgi:hypothetical protein
VITDAIEGCLRISIQLSGQAALPGASYPMLESLAMEENLFYHVPRRSNLMADVPRNFTLVAKRNESSVESASGEGNNHISTEEERRFKECG